MSDGLPNPLLDLAAEEALSACRLSLQFARAGQWGLRRGDPRVDWSDAVCALHRLPAGTRPELGVVLERVQEDQRDAFRQAIDDCLDSGRGFELDLTLVRGIEERVFVRVLGEAVRDGRGHILGLRGLYQDHTESQREQVRGQRQQRLLAAVAAGRPLEETLEQLLLDYEAGNPGAIGSVLLLDDHGERVRHGAGARLPLAYRQAIDGVEIGEARGSCGTAAYRRERVIVSDIAHDPLWRDFAALALGFELRACWSTPILNSQGRVIATFAVYYRQVRQPSEDEILELDAMSELVALAVEQSVLLDNVQQVMDSDVELICVIDDRARFVAVNAAARRLWGREPASLVGQPMDCVIHPEDLVRSHAEARAVMAGNRAVDFENRTLGPDGRVVEMSWSAVWSHRNQRMYCFGRDITAHRRFERELAQALSHDAVTALPRYGTLENLYAPLLARDAESQRPLWLIFIDLDRFQAINETMGEQVGDAALRTLAQRLQRALGGSGQLSRFAGDEFVAMVADIDAEQILHLAERIRIAVAEPVQVADVQLAITASIGISGFPQHGRSLSELLRRAEGAMGQAKREGRDGICLYSAASMQDFEDRLALGGRLRQAVRADELELHYQPQVRALDGRITGFEALVRWTRSPLGPVPPGRFIPIAEALGMMPELGHWVLRQACQQAQRWIADGHRDLTMAVNVSAHQLQRPDFLAGVREALRESGLAPARLQVELTESSLIENLQRVRNALDGLRALGISLALDDFGTGYSSLSYLKRLAFDKLKIDRSFVADLTVDADDAEIARTIIAIGHQLRMSVAAEGVETAEQCAYLRTMGCDELQGFLLSRPVPADAAEALLRAPAFRLPD